MEEVAGYSVRFATVDRDPNGFDQHAPGAKLDAGKVQPLLVLQGMPLALGKVAEVATYGADKYTKAGWLQVPDAVERYSNALLRHLLAACAGEAADAESGLSHHAHLAWNALAVLELLERGHDDQ